jgi:hypothetical protein
MRPLQRGERRRHAMKLYVTDLFDPGVSFGKKSVTA